MQFEATLRSKDAVINVDIIHPCTARHISKYSAQRRASSSWKHLSCTKLSHAPHMDSVGTGAVQWVYNILDKKRETERLLFEDADPETGFMLHPDQKWDQSQVALARPFPRLFQLRFFTMFYNDDHAPVRRLSP